jgi:hypothetical protein
MDGSMSVSLAASGPPVTESEKFHVKIPGNHTENDTFSGTFAFNANITSGSASFNGAPMDLVYGEFGYTKSFTVQVTK